MRYNAVFDILKGDEGAYASHLPAWLNFLCSYVDFGWFAAVLGWTLVLLWWWNISRRTAPVAWRWAPWSAAGGLAMAIIAFGDLIQARLGSSAREAYIAGDRAMTLVFLAGIAGWWVQAAKHQARRAGRHACRGLAVLPLVLLGWFLSLAPRVSIPLPAIGWLMVALSLLATIPWLFLPAAGGWARGALLLVAVLPLCSTVGPLARRIFFMSERFSPLTPLAAGAAAAQTLAAGVTLAGLVRLSLAGHSRAERSRRWREIRPFVASGFACVGLALLAAWWIGERQGESARERALDQARLAATQMDPEMIAVMLGPKFHLDEIWPGGRPYFPPTRLAYSKFLGEGAEVPAKRAFLPIARASRTMMHLRFVTLRDGWLVGMVGYTAPFAGSLAEAFGGTALDPAIPASIHSTGYVLLGRRPTGRDLEAWAHKAEWLEGPVCTPVFPSPAMFARAPVVTADGGMLGWLEFTYMADAFFGGVMQARVAPFVAATLGILLTALWFVQRRDARHRQSSQLAAVAAAAASRAKTEFLAKVSHELRTPLQSLLGYGEILSQHLATTAGRSHLAAQQQHGELMLRLVNDLIDLSAIEVGAFRMVEKPVNLAGLVTEAVASQRLKSDAKGLVLGCNPNPEFPPWILGDEQRLRQIVLNLTGNAIKFTERGMVEVDLATRHVAGGPMIELAVRDTGPGIPPADQTRLFQPFFRLESAGAQEGAGLGLALTAALCRSAGGGLTVESDGRTGSRFCVLLPLRSCAPPAAVVPHEALVSLRGRRILIADDNRLVRELFAAYLTDAGALCDQAADGQEAWEQAAGGRHEAIVLDVAMPRLDGFEIVRRLRKTTGAALRIVGVSAHVTSADHARARAAGMDVFLTKPVRLTELAAALSRQPPPAAMGSMGRLRSTVRELFRTDASAQADSIMAARARGDWLELKARAHYLKSSAGVIGDEQLYDACGLIEDAADARDFTAVDRAWEQCTALLARWRD